MKKKLWKITGFSFLVIFILSFWLGDRTRSTTDVNGLTSSEIMTTFEYFIKTVGYSLVITAVILLAVYLIDLIQKKSRKKSS